MSEFTERVRREAQERLSALNEMIGELEAERVQLEAVVTAIEAYEPRKPERESEDRSLYDELAEPKTREPLHDDAPSVHVKATGPDGETLGEWVTHEDGRHEVEPEPSEAEAAKSELESEVEEEATPQPTSDSEAEAEEEAETPGEPEDDEEPSSEPAEQPEEPEPDTPPKRNGVASAAAERGARVREENEKAVRDAAQAFGRPFNRRELGEALGMSPHSTSITNALRALVERGTLVRTGGQAGPNVKYEWVKPDPRSGPRERPRHDGPRQHSKRGDRGQAVPHVGRAKGRSGKPGRDKKMAELGFKVKRGASGGRRV